MKIFFRHFFYKYNKKIYTMVKQLNSTTRAQILQSLRHGSSTRKVAEMFNVSHSTVIRTKQKYDKYRSYDHMGQNGRRKISSAHIVDTIKLEIKKTPKKSLRKIQSVVLSDTGTKISHVSVKNILNRADIFAYSPIKKPLLSKKNIQLRFEISQKWLYMGIEKIKSIIFSDESKFNLFYSDGKSFVWREPGTGLLPKHLDKTVKYDGGSVIVWGVFHITVLES